MHIVILGSGVIGITSAYYLALAGHEVTVIDRQPGPALETSFANAGQISPGCASPWAAPGVPLKAIKWMLQRHAPLSVRPDGSVFQLQWMWQMLRNCSSERYAINKERMVRLAEYSRDCLKLLREQTGIAYEGRQRGTLQLFRTDRQFEHAARNIRVLQDAGVRFELLTREQVVNAEPALGRVSGKLAGALRLPNDETGDCHLFSTRLAGMAAALGVRFRHDMAIDLLSVSGDSVDCVLCGDEVVRADAYVVALGAHSTTLLRPIMNIPVYPMKGYSITLPIVDRGAAPVSTVLDETWKVAVTRFDDRIRVGGMAELAGFDHRLNPRRRATLEMVVNDLFPGAGDRARASFWTGLRPMTPDGTPLIGRTGLRNLYLNTGHGTLGWTMACGSAQLLADIISARRPAIAFHDLAVGRYCRPSSSDKFSFNSRKVST